METKESGREAGGMSTRAASWLAWSACALSLTLTGVALVLLAANRSHPNAHVFDYGTVLTVITVSTSPVGALIASRRPQNPLGWIICAIGLGSGIEHFAGQYAIYALLLSEPTSLSGGEVFAWITSWLWVPSAGLLVFLLLLFPDGRLASGRWRWFAWLSATALTVGTVSAAFLPGPIDGLGPIRNPLGIEGARYLLGPVVSGSAALAEGLLALVAAVSLLLRLRHAKGEERQRIKWFAYAITVMASGFFLTYTVAEAIDVWWVWWAGFGLTMASVLGVQLSIGIAILKHRLFDIDLIINRTLVYATLTATLALLYLGGIVVLQQLFVVLTGEKSTLAVVASTLVIAALFTPLRRRIQSFIDRRFYRRKYDAAKTLDAFSSKLREETELDTLNTELVAVVRATMQPAHAGLWLLEPQHRRDGSRDDRRVATTRQAGDNNI
jgi:hypothetical protein